MRLPLLCSIVVASLLATFAAPPADAQEITGTITGTVRDGAGLPVPGANVTVRNLGTNARLTQTTDSTGVFNFPLLQSGRYEIVAELQGFKRFITSDVQLNVNDRLRVDVTLQPGAVEENITVVGATPLVRTETSTIGTLIDSTQVARMPLNGRNVIQLVAMQPGVSSTLGSTMFPGLGQLTNVYVNGSRASQNNWMVDGADNNDAGSNLAVINNVNVDAVAEVSILRANYSAEFGRNSGGQINVVTKSGTNQWRGSVFEYMRDDQFDAAPFFGTYDPDGDGKLNPLPLDYHNFGGTVGGRILTDRLFFFWGQEFRKIETIRGNGRNLTRTPTERQRNGDFSQLSTPIIDPVTGVQFQGNIIPSGRLDPVAVQLARRFPAPNADPAILGSNRNFGADAPQTRDFRQELVRVDYRFSPNNSFYVRFMNDTIPSEEPFGEVFGTNQSAYPGIASTKTDNPGRSLVANWTWVVSPNLVSEVAYNYSRGAIFSEIIGNATRDVSVPKVFSGGPGDALLPGISFSNDGYGGWNFFGPYDNTYGSHRFKTTVSNNRGAHALKAGVLLSWEFKNENGASGTNGSFVFPGRSSASFRSTGDAFADFMLGRASSYSETNIDITSHLRYNMYELFAQDDWKVRSNLTLNLGLRWSYIGSPTDTENLLTNFDPALFNPARAYQIDAGNLRVPGTGDPLNGLVIAGQNSPYGDAVIPTEKTNFGPRAGFAWDVTGDGKTAVRGGYGLYFDRTLVGTALQNAFVNPPFAFSAVFNSTLDSGPTLSNPQAGTARNNEALVPALIALDPNYRTPRTHQYSIGVQHELPFRFLLDAAYVGAQGRNLLQPVDINKAPPGTVAPSNRSRPFPGFGNITMRQTTASSTYNSLQLALSRRFDRGFQVSANYTLSKAESDSSSDRGAPDLPQDPRNLAAERAVTTYDRTHIFGAHYIWELPFLRKGTTSRLIYNVAGGWDITGSTRVMTGLPLTVTTGTNSANAFGGGALRPDLVGDPKGEGTVTSYFNTAAFVQPAPNRYGNSPRSVIRLPYINVTDLAVFKNFDTASRVDMQFRLEIFNLFNRTNYTAAGTVIGNATFGRLTTAAEPRLMQLGIRATF